MTEGFNFSLTGKFNYKKKGFIFYIEDSYTVQDFKADSSEDNIAYIMIQKCDIVCLSI